MVIEVCFGSLQLPKRFINSNSKKTSENREWLYINKKEDFVAEILLVTRMGSAVTQYGVKKFVTNSSIRRL